jgi:hypothetical protein
MDVDLFSHGLRVGIVLVKANMRVLDHSALYVETAVTDENHRFLDLGLWKSWGSAAENLST